MTSLRESTMREILAEILEGCNHRFCSDALDIVVLVQTADICV